METYSLNIAYNGAPFAGFARQPGQLTVQGELEGALSLIFRNAIVGGKANPAHNIGGAASVSAAKDAIEITCAGRTDAGVHARGQVVSFNLPEGAMATRNPKRVLRSISALTHELIVPSDLRLREPGFSARFDAKAREYRYFIYSSPNPAIFMHDFSWHVKSPLDIEAMQEAAKYLIGEHDFKSFCMASSAEGRRTYRCVNEISLFTERVMDEKLLTVKIEGNAFLHSMVRAIVGTLVACGRGLRKPEWVGDVLQAKDRRAAGENAPAQGLVLWSVKY